MIFYLDTTDRRQALIALVEKDNVIKHVFKISVGLSEELPKEIEDFLKGQKVSFTDIKKVAVCSGPGSFIGTRTGVAFANAFAKSLDIPLAGAKKGGVPKDLEGLAGLNYDKKVVAPVYSAPPNITIK